MNSVIGKTGHLSRRIARRVLRESVRRSPPIARRALSKSIRRLPLIAKERQAPQGVLPSAAEWCQQHADLGARYFPLELGQDPSIEEPLTLELMPEHYLWHLRAKTPAQFVATIPAGRVCQTGLVLTPDNYLLGNLSYQTESRAFRNGKIPIQDEIRLPPVRKVEGKVGVVSSLWANNYYHWMFDVVPRFHLLRQSGIAADQFVVPCKESFQKQILDMLGIPPEQRIFDKARLHLQAECLVVPSLPGSQGNPPRWLTNFLRETLTAAALQSHPEPASSPSRIYISRAKANGRRVVNEEEVLEILKPLGFQTTTLEGLSVAEQILLFRNVEAVVAPHGAALSNLVFCRPQTRVLEFFAPGWIFSMYSIIGANGGLRFACLVGEGERPLPDNHSRYRDRDIVVNLPQLKSMLKKLEL